MGHSKSHLGSTNDLTSNRGSRIPSVLSPRGSDTSEATVTDSDRNFFANPEYFDNKLQTHQSTRSVMGGSIGSIMERSEFERESEISDASWGEKDHGETRVAANSGGLGSTRKGKRGVCGCQ